MLRAGSGLSFIAEFMSPGNSRKGAKLSSGVKASSALYGRRRSSELAAKELEMMAEALPQTRRIGVLWNPTTPSHSRALPAVETAGEKLALELRMVPARGPEDFDSAFATMARERVGAFLAVGSRSEEHTSELQ